MCYFLFLFTVVFVVFIFLICRKKEKYDTCGGYNLQTINNPESYKIITSFTTTPNRIFKTKKTLYSLSHQTYRPDYLLVNIPERFLRTNEEYIIPKFIKRNKDVKINVLDIDYGPATKLVGAILYIPKEEDTWIVVHDDDQMYLQETIEEYIKHINIYNNKRIAFSIGGFNLNENNQIERPYKNMSNISFIEGYQTYCVHRSVFEDDFIPYIKSQLSNKEAFQSDDLIISNYLAMKNIDIKLIYNNNVNFDKWWECGCELDYGNQEDALKNISSSSQNDPLGGHFDKYLRVIKYLKEKKQYYI